MQDGRALRTATRSTGDKPTANGRVVQETSRVCDARTAGRMNLHGLLLAFVAFEDRTEAARTSPSAACVAAHETGPNV